jgi:ergothioneine biosynthesis protein EgtB
MSLTFPPSGLEESRDVRRAGPSRLAAALRAARQDTLATFEAVRRARPRLEVPFDERLNPPLWELGHVGWFQEYWIARNPARAEGPAADPLVERRPGLRADADALYDSGRVAHRTRWSLALPGPTQTRDELDRQLDTTLALLATTDDDDTALYFFRLALLHEDMHHEAALYMAQALGLPVDDPRWHAKPLPAGPPRRLRLEAGPRRTGRAGPGFAFDNELPGQDVLLEAFEIDARVVSWGEYLPFVHDGGYGRRPLWSDEGWRHASTQPGHPRYLALRGGQWHAQRFGEWRPLDPRLPACHLSCHEAQAWCRWAGRRLPTEHEWEAAAREGGPAFETGAVWEWTASPFSPFPGFEPHPYRDYSAPWFDGRPVLRGGSFATQPRMKDLAYRNFFVAERNDIFAGFRSCALNADARVRSNTT